MVTVRALLIVGVLMTWVSCLIGVVGLSGYLVVVAGTAMRRSRTGAGRTPRRQPVGIVPALLVYAAIMIGFACILGGLAARASTPAGVVAWLALPTWAAVVATITAVVARRRTRASPSQIARA